MWPRSRRNTAEKRPIVGHMFEQLALTSAMTQIQTAQLVSLGNSDRFPSIHSDSL